MVCVVEQQDAAMQRRRQAEGGAGTWDDNYGKLLRIQKEKKKTKQLPVDEHHGSALNRCVPFDNFSVFNFFELVFLCLIWLDF